MDTFDYVIDMTIVTPVDVCNLNQERLAEIIIHCGVNHLYTLEIEICIGIQIPISVSFSSHVARNMSTKIGMTIYR